MRRDPPFSDTETPLTGMADLNGIDTGSLLINDQQVISSRLGCITDTMNSRIPRPAGKSSPPSPGLLYPPNESKSRSPKLPSSPSPLGSPRARPVSRIPSRTPPSPNLRPVSKSYFRSRQTSPTPAESKPGTNYTTRRPVPAYSNGDSRIPRTATRKVSLPGLNPLKLKNLPINTLNPPQPPSKTIPTPTKPLPRKRATSFAALRPKVKPKPPEQLLPAQPIRASPLQIVHDTPAEETPPTPPPKLNPKSMNVPTHIRLRLRLIHQLGIVLGVPPSRISEVLDISGLLARVDATFEKGAGMSRKRDKQGSVVMVSSRVQDKDGKWWMYPPNWSSGDRARNATGTPTPARDDKLGMMESLRKLG